MEMCTALQRHYPTWGSSSCCVYIVSYQHEAGWHSWLRWVVLGPWCRQPRFESLPNLVDRWEKGRLSDGSSLSFVNTQCMEVKRTVPVFGKKNNYVRDLNKRYSLQCLFLTGAQFVGLGKSWISATLLTIIMLAMQFFWFTARSPILEHDSWIVCFYLRWLYYKDLPSPLLTRLASSHTNPPGQMMSDLTFIHILWSYGFGSSCPELVLCYPECTASLINVYIKKLSRLLKRKRDWFVTRQRRRSP